MTQTVMDAEALYVKLRASVESMLTEQTQIVGIASGGAWLAERLCQDFPRKPSLGIISSAMHRDDFAQRGLSSGQQTTLPFDVNGADIVLIDDVLFTGRTIRAVINELFDYGRPARVRLAVLVDRGDRELPVQADFAAMTITMSRTQALNLVRDVAGQFSFDIQGS